MSVRARFYINSVTLNAGDTAVANLGAVSRGKENSEWSQYSPSGSLQITLTRKASGARQFFLDHIGREVYLDITLADDPVCTQCGKEIQRNQAGTGIHSGADGYVSDEFVHNECATAAKERLGIA